MPHAQINFHKPAKSPNALLHHMQLNPLDTQKPPAANESN